MLFDNFLKTLEILASNANFVNGFYLKVFSPRVVTEIRGAQISRDDNVLHIGCGAVPYTPEIIARYTGAKVVAIDNDPKMIIKARSYIQKKRISNVQIRCGEGIDFPLEKFNVIYVSLGVCPLEATLKRIIKEGKGKRIIFRVSTHLVGILYNKSAYFCTKGENLGGRIRKSKILFL